MAEAFRCDHRSITTHDKMLPDLEQRRREVKRDFDMLQRDCPIEPEVIQ